MLNKKNATLAYLLIISLLGGYALHLYQKKKRQMEQYNLSTKTENEVHRLIESFGYKFLRDIRKSTDAYRDSTQKNIEFDADRLQVICHSPKNTKVSKRH
jgi:hypothetical protein